MSAPTSYTTKETTLWSLEVVKEWLAIDPSQNSQDKTLKELADAVSEFIEAQTGRVFVTRSFTEVQNSKKGQDRIFLQNFPATAVTSVQVRWAPTDTSPETLSTDYYRVDLTKGVIWVHSYRLPEGFGCVTVGYSAGYGAQDATTLPRDVYAMGLELLKLIYTEKFTNRVGATSISLGGNNFIINPSWPKQIKDMLENWTKRF